MKFDAIDRRILRVVQETGRASHVEIADKVALSASQVQRRMRALEDAGVIDRYVALLSPRKLGLMVTAWVSVTMRNQGNDDSAKFQTAIGRLDQIVECHMLSGDADYLLKVVANDLESLSTFLRNRLLSLAMVEQIRSQIVFETVKSTTELPV